MRGASWMRVAMRMFVCDVRMYVRALVSSWRSALVAMSLCHYYV